MNKIKIILVDDHTLVRNGLKSLLINDFEIIGECDNGLELLEMLTVVSPDVIIMDLSMPKMGGIEALQHIVKKYPDIGVIILSMHDEPEYLVQAIQYGASSYLLKNVEKDELIVAVKKVANGEKYLNSNSALLLSKGLIDLKKQKKEEIKITEREKEVLACIVNGLSNKQIANNLFLSVRTIETHRNNLLKKFESHNTAELIKKVNDRKIIIG